MQRPAGTGQPIRVVVDCDPGIDDALALLFLAARPDAEIVALGSVHGNVTAELAARNASRVLDVARLDVAVAVGARRPLAQALHTAEPVHGDDGLGNTAQPPPRRRPVAGSAAEQLVTLARGAPGELCVLAIGPLTNLALALLIEPELPRLLRRVVLMGGAYSVAGNLTAHAEANIWHDPEAARLVFEAGWDLTAVGLDVTHKVLIGSGDLARLASSTAPAARFATGVLAHYAQWYQGGGVVGGLPVHDALAAAALLDADLLEVGKTSVEVELAGTATRGATLVDRRGLVGEASTSPLVSVATDVDAPRAVGMLLDALVAQPRVPSRPGSG